MFVGGGEGVRFLDPPKTGLDLSPIQRRRKSPSSRFDPKDHVSTLLLIPPEETIDMWLQTVAEHNKTNTSRVIGELEIQLKWSFASEPLFLELWMYLAELIAEINTPNPLASSSSDATANEIKRSGYQKWFAHERQKARRVYTVIEQILSDQDNYFSLKRMPENGFRTWQQQRSEIVRFFSTGELAPLSL